MNKYQDALDCIENTFCGKCHQLHIIEGTLTSETLCDCKKGNCYIHDLHELVDRAMQKKPRYEHAPEPSKAYKYDCPVCGCFLSMNYKIKEWLYCPECGQALNWSKDES